MLEEWFTDNTDRIHIEEEDCAHGSVKFAYASGDETVMAYASFPMDFDITKKYPLLIFNRGGRGERGKLTPDTLAMFTKKGAIVSVGSQYYGNDGGTGRDEYCGRDIDSVHDLIELMKRQYYIDANHIYMVGFSRGGAETYILARDRKDIKAIAVVSGLCDFFEIWANIRIIGGS